MRFLADIFTSPGRLAFALALTALGCQPNIGDDCRNHAECAYSGTRICEPNFPGGYCTIFNCEPGSCPDEAVCVAYGSVPSPRPECSSATETRLQRTFCMKSCDERSDCRDDEGYACVDLSDPNQNPWGALVVERGAAKHKICTIPLTGELAPVKTSDTLAGVCAPPQDASFPTPAPDPSDAGARDGSVPDASTDGAPPMSVPDAATSRDAQTDAPTTP